jgi:hypothetical protein
VRTSRIALPGSLPQMRRFDLDIDRAFSRHPAAGRTRAGAGGGWPARARQAHFGQGRTARRKIDTAQRCCWMRMINGRSMDGCRCRSRKEAPKAGRSSDRIAAAQNRGHGRPSATLRMLYAACRSHNSAVRKRTASRTAAPRGTPGRCRAVPSCSRNWPRSLFPAGAKNSWRSPFSRPPQETLRSDRPVFDLAQIAALPSLLHPGRSGTAADPRRLNVRVEGSRSLDRTSYGLCGASVGRALRHSRVAAGKRRQYVAAIPQPAAKPIELIRCLSSHCIAFNLSAEIRLRVVRRMRKL